MNAEAGPKHSANVMESPCVKTVWLKRRKKNNLKIDPFNVAHTSTYKNREEIFLSIRVNIIGIEEQNS